MSIEADTPPVYGPVNPGSLVGFAARRNENPHDVKTSRDWEREMGNYQKEIGRLIAMVGVSPEELERMSKDEIDARIATLGPPQTPESDLSSV